MSTPLLPTILGIRSVDPPFLVSQADFYESLAKEWYAALDDASQLARQTRVEQRFFFWDPRLEYAAGNRRGTGARMQAFEETVVGAARQSIEALLQGVDRERVGSFVSATNTGYLAPMIDCSIARDTGLRRSLRRTVIGSMGCFAAFNTIKVAIDSVLARPDELVLVNCTEASSLHFRDEATKEQALIHFLFADATASMIIGAAPEHAGPQFLGTHTAQFYETADLMTLRITDHGFRMTLSPFVPFVLAENILSFLAELLAPFGLAHGDIQHWGIHPGGPKILELLAARLGLSEDRLRASWHILRTRGNCAAATTLLVLEEILRNDAPARGEHGVFLSFGPGLTIEGALVRF